MKYNIYNEITVRDRFKQGRFKPNNPQKYKGNPNNIIYRSSFELKMMRRFDDDPNVIWWESEERFVLYRSPIDNRPHRYFIDFFVKIKDSNNKYKIYAIEVKPFKQTSAPVVPKRKTARYLTEVVEWGVNKAKWAAAEEYCKDRGYEFIIMTENDIFGKTK